MRTVPLPRPCGTRCPNHRISRTSYCLDSKPFVPGNVEQDGLVTWLAPAMTPGPGYLSTCCIAAPLATPIHCSTATVLAFLSHLC